MAAEIRYLKCIVLGSCNDGEQQSGVWLMPWQLRVLMGELEGLRSEGEVMEKGRCQTKRTQHFTLDDGCYCTFQVVCQENREKPEITEPTNPVQCRPHDIALE